MKMEKYVEVQGGVMTGGDDHGKNSVFTVKKRPDGSNRWMIEVVLESKLGAFFRRDTDFASTPAIQLRNTNEEPTVIFWEK